KDLPAVNPPGTRRLEIQPARRRGTEAIQKESGAPGGASDVAALLEQLRHRPGVHHATMFGQTIHALVDADCTAADLGLGEAVLHPTEPTLEDVFVSLTRAQAP